MLSLPVLIIILLALVIISAFFSASEIGMMSLNRYRLRHLVKKNNKKAIWINELLKRPEKLLSVILIGNTLANIIASTVATLIGQAVYGAVGVAFATGLITLIILVISEMLPKTFAAMYPLQVAFIVALPLKILHILMAPMVKLVGLITNFFLYIMGVSLNPGQREALSADELRSVVNEADSLLPTQYKNMVIGLLDLEKVTVEDIMIPTADIMGIDLEKSWQDILDQLENAQHTRLPLYRDSIDHLIGLVHVRNVLNLSLEKRLDKQSLEMAAEAPYFVPEGTSLDTQMLNFQKMKKRSCFVVDEYGDLQGLVTLEDILEEVIGEFTTNMDALSKDIVEEEGGIIVDASITLRNLQRIHGWQLPSLGPRTLSGVIIEYLGYIPPANCCLAIENYQIEILKVADNTIKTARIRQVRKNSFTEPNLRGK